ncbi:MAG: arylsulfatase [Burkholderiales bacterium]
MTEDSQAFQGKIGRTREESTPWWPEPESAPAGAPNIVIVYMDDMGYSDAGCYGSEIATPHIDALAARGLRFNHYTTHPICSPARAALLTGINAHAVNSGWLANNHPGFPGYSGDIPLDAATLAETLRERGYATQMVGKWHNTLVGQSNPASAKHTWPAQRGFESFYGFMEGETSYFFPARLMLGNAVLPIDDYPPDYYSTDDWTDKAIGFVRDLRAHAPGKPFFLYLSHNAVHAPLQAKPVDLAKYRGRYDAGWTRLRAERHQRQLAMGLIPPGTPLAPPDPKVPSWDDTDPADRPLYARHMEAYAAVLDCADQNLGRLSAYLKSIGELDNTIIVFSSDNGATDAGGVTGRVDSNRRFADRAEGADAAAERASGSLERLGGPRSMPLYPAGWGQVSNTPFPTYKTYTGGGGRRVPFVISWPAKIRDVGEIRSQFAHVTDVMPTLLALAGLEPLATVNGRSARPLDGASFARVLFDAAAPPARTEQYYECWANRAFYRDGWLARSLQKRGEPVDLDNWTLHNLTADFSEGTDLATRHPERLSALTAAFDRAAWANQVYPLDNRKRQQKLFNDGPPHLRNRQPASRTFQPGAQTVHRGVVMPMIADRSYRITCRFDFREGDAGVLWAIGDPGGGMVMYIETGSLHLFYNGFGDAAALAPVKLQPGVLAATLEYEALGARRGRGRLLIDGVAQAPFSELSPTLMNGLYEGLDIGLDRRGPVSGDLYARHGIFRYSGTVRDVTIEPGARLVAPASD